MLNSNFIVYLSILIGIILFRFSNLSSKPNPISKNKFINTDCSRRKFCREDCVDKAEKYKNIAMPVGILAWGLSAPFQDQTPLISNFYEECSRDCERSVPCEEK